MKNLAKLSVVKALSSKEQKSINGGLAYEKPYIGSICLQNCPSNCEFLGGVCIECTDFFGDGFECRIY